MIHGIIYICPECKKIAMYDTEGLDLIDLTPLICVEDGYTMKLIVIDNAFEDRLLKDQTGGKK